MADFDVIVVGAGPAGCAAATVAARAGLKTLLLERGLQPGSKSMSGGRVYAYSLAQVWPEYKQAMERRVVRETVSMVDGDSVVNFQLQATDLPPSYTVLRAEFDAWAAAQAVAAGAELVCPVTVEKLLYSQGRVAGVAVDKEEISSEAVILAEGSSGKLAMAAGLKAELKPSQAAVGFKELIELPEEVINQRFNLNSGQGAAQMLAGSMTANLPASGAFLYTNKNSISLGMVIGLAGAGASGQPIYQYLGQFKQHPAIAPLIANGKSVEYSAHLIPEAGFNALPILYSDNLLLAGDVAGMVINQGYTVRGMDLAICAGMSAGRALIACQGNYSRARLGQAYEKELSLSQVLPHLKAYRNMPSFIDLPRLTATYPAMTVNIFKDMFSFDGRAPRALFTRKLLPQMRKAGFINLLKDACKAKGAF